MNVLFIVEGSLSNPILFSQGIPHIKENSKKGVKYFVLSFEETDLCINDPTAKKRYDEAISELKGSAEIYSIKLKRNKITDFLHLSTSKMIILGIIKCLKIVKKKEIDIIHGRSNLPTLISLIVKKLSNVKVVYDNRGLVSNEFDKQKRIRIRAEQLIEKYLVLKSDLIVVVSKAFKKYLCDKFRNLDFESKISVIENSFSEKRFIFSESLRLKQRLEHKLEDKFVMIYSGPGVSWQRFDLVLTTFKKLKKIKGEAYLLVVSYDPEIQNMILSSGIEESDFAIYNLMASQVNSFLIMGDFGVIFRDDRIRSKVCAPIKLGEYLASGLPILCMNHIGDTDEIVSGYGVGVIMQNESNIKNDLNDIIKLTSEQNIRLRCRKVAEEKLSLAISAKKYYSNYSRLI